MLRFDEPDGGVIERGAELVLERLALVGSALAQSCPEGRPSSWVAYGGHVPDDDAACTDARILADGHARADEHTVAAPRLSRIAIIAPSTFPANPCRYVAPVDRTGHTSSAERGDATDAP